ncbi:MAG TPA: TMEM175 family protein, partial [Ilumatobacter sp.]
MAISILTGALWLAHSAITDYLHATNPTLVRLNLLLLMVVSFLPFPTRLLAEYLGETDAARVA